MNKPVGTNANDAPLPQVGAGQFADVNRQPWQRSDAHRTIALSGANTVLLVATCANLQHDDYRRCLRFLAAGSFRQAMIAAFGFVLMMSVLVNAGGNLSETVTTAAFLFVCVALCLGVVWGLLLIGVERASFDQWNGDKNGSLFCFASDLAFHIVSASRQEAVPWQYLRRFVEKNGDLYFFWYKDKNESGCLFVPRRAFTSREQAVIFRDAVQCLAKAHGNPSVLTPEMQAGFAPQPGTLGSI